MPVIPALGKWRQEDLCEFMTCNTNNSQKVGESAHSYGGFQPMTLYGYKKGTHCRGHNLQSVPP